MRLEMVNITKEGSCANCCTTFDLSHRKVIGHRDGGMWAMTKLQGTRR